MSDLPDEPKPGEGPEQPPEQQPEYLIVGQVVAPFGVKGALKVNVLTEFPERFQKLKEVVLAPFSAVPPEQVPSATLNPATLPPLAARVQVPDRSFSAPLSPSPIEIASIQGHKGHLILSLAGVTTPEAAETLRGYWLFVPRDKAQRLPRGSYYIYQIVGMGVYTAGGDLVGHVREVLTSAANDVYVVRGPGVTDPTGELLVPAIKAIVQSIDADTRRIVIAPPEEWA